jgi:hypothetical protein
MTCSAFDKRASLRQVGARTLRAPGWSYARGLPTGIRHRGCSFTASVNARFTSAS